VGRKTLNQSINESMNQSAITHLCIAHVHIYE